MLKFNKEKFADGLCYHLGRLEWTSNRLASEAGISATMVAQYVSGESQPKVDKLVDLANALDVDVMTLILGKTDLDEMVSTGEHVFGMPVEKAIEILKGLDKWTQGDFNKLIELIHGFVSRTGKLDQAHGIMDAEAFMRNRDQ